MINIKARLRKKQIRNAHNRNKNTGRKIYKLNEDDILEIVSEYLAAKDMYTEYQFKSQLLGTTGVDLRFVMIIDDHEGEIESCEILSADLETDFNGDH